MTQQTLVDASRIIVEACVRSGADVYVGYPITPANWFYTYAQKRFPQFIAAPDEITVLQWMAGFSAAGKMPVTATSFPGFALMIESLNMAYMMELPMLIILAQRLGPSTGAATTGAQGDLMLLRGCISGGYPLPVFCPSDFDDCWTLTHRAIKTAIEFRTPVVLLTSKEMVMTQRSFDLEGLCEIHSVRRSSTVPTGEFRSYKTDENGVPPMIPVGNDIFQVRINASTHDNEGLIRKASPESLANTRRLRTKFENRQDEIAYYDLDRQEDAETIILTYGVSADAARDAVRTLRRTGEKVSLMIAKTLIPFPVVALSQIKAYKRVLIAEENLTGLLGEMLFGLQAEKERIHVNKIGSMITPVEIINAYNYE